MKIKAFTFNMFGVNTYLIWNEQTRNAAAIDPGMINADEQRAFNSFIQSNDLKLTAMVNTHMHIDHSAGNYYIAADYGLPTTCNPEDAYLADNLTAQADMFGIPYNGNEAHIQKELHEGDEITLADTKFRVLHIPGHTKGHIVLYAPSENVLFSGDALFQMSIGRTDLPGGDYTALIQNLQAKVLTLPRETVVYPGHGPKTTIGFEVDNNPYF